MSPKEIDVRLTSGFQDSTMIERLALMTQDIYFIIVMYYISNLAIHATVQVWMNQSLMDLI